MRGDEQRPSRLRQPLQQRAELGAPRRDRATPSARPSAGPADSPPTLARWPLSALLRPTARAATRRPAIRRQAVSADREPRVPLPRGATAIHMDEVRDRRSAVPTCARTGSGTGTRARRCAATGATSRDRECAALRGARRPLEIVPRSNGSRPAMARRMVVLPRSGWSRSAIRSPGRASRLSRRRASVHRARA